MSSDSLYVACAEVLSLCRSKKDDLDALLDPQTGFAPRIRQICEEQLADYAETQDPRIAPSDIESLRLEANTWGLLQTIMPSSAQSAHALLAENPYTPTTMLAQAIMSASPLLSELIVVREWLQDTAPAPIPPEANTGYWKFTKHSVMQSIRTGNPHRGGLVTEMDPDALEREPGGALAPDDASYERSLLQALYGYVRAGRLDDAMEVCRKANQTWRAASIRGAWLFQWKAISTEQRDEDTMDADEDSSVWTGNLNRKLWKTACIKAATNTTLPEYERYLYAALAPSPKTLATLKGACKSWEDHLWALICITCEEKESAELEKLGGFWEEGLQGLEKGLRPINAREEEEEEEGWKEEVISTLETLKSMEPTSDDKLVGPGGSDPFHDSQLSIILNQTEELLEKVARLLSNGILNPTNADYTTLCRFFAHLCLFLQMIDITPPPMAMQKILEAYLQVLEDAGQRELIAMYAGALGDNAVDRYAAFLLSLALSADINERHLALTRARDHGLDMERVAIAAAELTIDRAMQNLLPKYRDPLPSLTSFPEPASEDELLLFRSIEWTTFMTQTHNTALEQANLIVRHFLATGRVQLAHQFLEVLPSELSEIKEPEDRTTEYLHYRQFFTIWESLESVVESQSLQVPGMTKEAKSVWLADYRSLIDRAYDDIVNLLTSEWLVTDVENPSGDQRRRELIRIRQIYIPEIIIRMHSHLVASRHLIPDNLKRSLELVNIVADSRYKLYEDFVPENGKRLQDYLTAVRQAVLAGIEGGGSDPFRVITN
ncbi:nuclear pore protein 84/107 [Crucibulum laeve]|uniref:Nuclear pore complex protein n=1 Tax=Crucibulum laeve TaxID=68775 RepID=A0A5C3MBQ0_9AGAR|nr:nuclear pore protein 84/107 [Crucibulum laeve]